jgi:hypothetical protein
MKFELPQELKHINPPIVEGLEPAYELALRTALELIEAYRQLSEVQGQMIADAEDNSVSLDHGIQDTNKSM